MLIVLLAMALSGHAAEPPRAATGSVRVVLLGCGVSGTGRLVLDTGERPPWTAPVLEAPGGRIVALGPSNAGLAGGEGTLVLDGQPPVRVTWDASVAGLSRCRLDETGPATDVAFVEGRIVVDDDAAATPEVVGCGGWTRTDADGSYRMATLASGPCGIYARKSESSPWQLQGLVAPRAGATTYVGITAITVREPLFEVEPGTRRVIARRDERGFRTGDVVVSVGDVDLTRAAEPLLEVQAALTTCPGIAQFVIERSGRREALSIACGML